MSTVLIIEDQPELGSILRLVVSRRGHRALLATSIAEADLVWRSLKAEIDLVITDNLLPDGSGIQYAATLTAEKPTLKLIITTGLPEGSIPAGAHRMDKPFQVATLMEKLDQLLQPETGAPDDKSSVR